MTQPDENPLNDPFRNARRATGLLVCPFQGREIPMLLRHSQVRAAAKDWQNFSSDAPFRVPIPSEEDFRRMRQLPIESDPPSHAEYRRIVEPFFRRARNPEVVAAIESLIERLLNDVIGCDSLEAVHDFALPVQSRALAHLLKVPKSEAEIWIGWGLHVFGDKSPGERTGETLERYLEGRFEQARHSPGDDFFSELSRASYQGRPLTHEEMMGFANLTFAGGRDTVIHTISTILHHMAIRPEDLRFLREDPARIDLASEEFFRIASPLTHIGRVCPEKTDVHGFEVATDERISLCWISANHDEAVFDQPHEIRLDRKPNPHVAFGAGPHTCLGAPHARLVVRALLRKLAERVESVELLGAERLIEREALYERANGFASLTLRLVAG